MLRFVSVYNVVAVNGWSILYHAISALTMTKITNISMENENDAMLFGKSNFDNIDNTIIRK